MAPPRFSQKHGFRALLLCTLLASGICAGRCAEDSFDLHAALAGCNVSWNAPGSGPDDSMPLGNGDIGLNVWTEQNGDLVFYISKTDAWTENVAGSYGLAKLGRIRVALDPSPFRGSKAFAQTLDLSRGLIEVSGSTGDTLTIWVDANNPVIHVQAKTAKPATMTVHMDPWRTVATDQYSADIVLPPRSDTLGWYHRDAKPRAPQVRDLTFGAVVKGSGLKAADERTLRSAGPATAHAVSIYPLTTGTGTVEQWQAKLAASVQAADATDVETALKAHLDWWEKFWSRSWIFLSGDKDAAPVTQGYQLQRFVTACAGRGGYPVKFNGSIFTVDNPSVGIGRNPVTKQDINGSVTADFRSWGGQYWFQNTRPMYWPRLMAGDFDEMQPLFRMYRDMLPANSGTIREYCGHGGAYFAETAPFWGGMPKLLPADKGSYTRDYFTPILELSSMMLDYYDYTGDAAFARETLIPVVSAGLQFFDEHFKRDANGKLLLDPDNSIEMFWRVRNPLPDIAGLHYVTARLLAMPDSIVSAPLRQRATRLAGELPPVPMGARDGKKVILPFEDGQTPPSHNSENPELYAIYPFRLYGLGKPDLQVARDTFDMRRIKTTGCWVQDPVQAAFIGYADLAKKDVTFDLTRKDRRLRFPAFWDKGHDYMPDEDNGGNGENGLQHMLMQCDNGKITLLPAWPAGWNADFRLCAPGNTTIQASVRDGKVRDLVVQPESRKRDVILPQ